MADDPASPGWRDAAAVLEQIFARHQVPATIAGPVVTRAMTLFRAFDAQMRLLAPRDLQFAVPLSVDDRAKLQAFYSAYELATIKAITLAVIEVELPKFKPASG